MGVDSLKKLSFLPPVVEKIGQLFVVRDDLLGAGSKARFVGPLIESRPDISEWVYGSCPASGWAQLSLPIVCRAYGKRATLFMAAHRSLSALTCTAIEAGANIHFIEHGRMSVTEARARAYVAESPKRALLPLGLDHPLVIDEIARVAQALPIEPSEIWTVGGSGTLSRGLQLAWPKAPAHIVAIGHKLSAEQLGRAKLWRYGTSFTSPVAPKDAPPYPSVATYDAKVWKFARAYAKPGALIWNVAADNQFRDLIGEYRSGNVVS
jgi:hypothetical protein